MFAKFFRSLFKKKPLEPREDAPVNPPAEMVAETLPQPPATATAEELCELRDGMTHEELRAQLSRLYRRHNRAASSLNPELREQAERMLDAIVEIRHRYLDLDGEEG